jgi:hypothetical protein
LKKLLLILLFISTFLYAESDYVSTNLVLESESFELDHESAYGVTNSYTLLIAEHQIHANQHVVFYYGTKVGFIMEECTAANGFGPSAEKFGTILKTNLGMDYDIKVYQKLSFEGSHSQNEIYRQIENQVKIAYQYEF